ncbi:hypothetical protein F2Q70_00006474 [Brassica cretica]|uniref:t-SNARE coiled-coil homology domain-containing protein n=1 Tax=Brassica cretica TaxID=69181 RepID=A0A8S9J685_BRACR|nr:hypothetical protein F2Q70_00006474 [Brassica cretica]
MSISQFHPPLWRPAAQRNLRNQWSKLSTCRKQWISACSVGMSHANSLANSYLSQTFVPMMKFGVLSDVFDIKKKALKKLSKQHQSSYRDKLLSSYKEMVAAVVEMVNVSRSMRCYMKPSSRSIIQFSCSKEDLKDSGDCGGIPVFSFWNISAFGFVLAMSQMITEKMAEELVEMFKREVMLKRLLMMELVSLSSEVPQPVKLSWADELYQGEFDDLSKCSLYSTEVSELILPRLKEDNLCISSVSHTNQPTAEMLHVCESPKRRVNHLETREKLGLNHLPKPHSRTHEPLPESAGAYQKIEMEKAKQDDGLADLSDLLGELKNMAIDMGTEIERQNNGLDHLQDDVDELNFRVKQSNQRARRLLRK